MITVTPEKADGTVVDSGATDTAPAAEKNASAPDVNTLAPAFATAQTTAEVPRRSIFGSENTIKAASAPKKTPAPGLSTFDVRFGPPLDINNPLRRPIAAVSTLKVSAPIVASTPATPHPASSEPAKWLNIAPSLDKHDISTSAFPVQTIVDDGDLKLFVGLIMRRRKVFLVASQALGAVSPVFKAMLGPTSSFKEAVALRNPGSEPPVVSLDDDSAAMEIVLNMLFHRHSRLPATETYTYSQIFQIALITEKYELHGVMRYWSRDLHKWFQSISQDAINDDSIFISWVFGYDDIFSKKTGMLTLRTTPYPGYPIAFQNLDPKTKVRTRVLICPSIPEAVIGKILEIRLRRIETLRGLLGSYYTLLVSAAVPHDLCERSITNPNRELCNNLISGSFMQQYKRFKLGNPAFWGGSVEEINEKLRAIPRVGSRVPGGATPGCMSCVKEGSGADVPLQHHTKECLAAKAGGRHEECGWEGALDAALRTWQDIRAEEYVIRLADFPSRKRK